MTFIAPNTETQIELIFEVSMIVDSSVQTTRVKVTVKPLTKSTDSNETNTSTNTLISITLSIDNNSLNLDSNATLNAVATYEDNTTKDVTDEVEWISSDSNAIQINKHNLQAKKEINIILQAKLNTVTSNAVALEIYQNINGHKLPPIPNKTLNDSTLLGIDLNNNGVRDDVERKIYLTYDKKINQKLMMQAAKTDQAMLADPDLIKNAYDWEEPYRKSAGCENYLFDNNIPFIPESVHFLEDSTYNTKDRIKKYIKYNQALSGGVFWTPASYEVESSCDFNVTEALGL
ncbi:hypothetical protein MNB_SM-4-74 [hydrothermal vent metagenome]|uniref:Uncharacterized protein n=1 Tax=hydrothermal vent metagenome TaxID=652676 RepID=A0A1W1BT00_9ZZZZ